MIDDAAYYHFGILAEVMILIRLRPLADNCARHYDICRGTRLRGAYSALSGVMSLLPVAMLGTPEARRGIIHFGRLLHGRLLRRDTPP